MTKSDDFLAQAIREIGLLREEIAKRDATIKRLMLLGPPLPVNHREVADLARLRVETDEQLRKLNKKRQQARQSALAALAKLRDQRLALRRATWRGR